ncbi:ABC transporter permease [Brevibacillus sp. SYSU BS000544]|uniref:ABC transporter permease n=1 Tax=Brevibacillus sp. SYSU BS000544 TaxID=3416443 RepID=UPI003CE554A9
MMYPILSVLILFALWEAVCWLGAFPAFILPSPSSVIVSLWELREFLFGNHLLVTLKEVLLGLLVSIIVGVMLAIVMRWNRPIEKIIYPYLVFSQTIPLVALSPVFIMWFGYSLSGKIAIATLFTFFPIVVSMYDGLGSAPKQMVDLLRTMGASRWQIFWKLQLPSSLPQFFSGLKVAATFSVTGATIGEWLGASEGLGYFGRRASGNFQAPALFASVLVLALLGILLFCLVSYIEHLFVKKRKMAVHLRKEA